MLKPSAVGVGVDEDGGDAAEAARIAEADGHRAAVGAEGQPRDRLPPAFAADPPDQGQAGRDAARGHGVNAESVEPIQL